MFFLLTQITPWAIRFFTSQTSVLLWRDYNFHRHTVNWSLSNEYLLTFVVTSFPGCAKIIRYRTPMSHTCTPSQRKFCTGFYKTRQSGYFLDSGKIVIGEITETIIGQESQMELLYLSELFLANNFMQRKHVMNDV